MTDRDADEAAARAALDYAANHIEGDARRGVFVRAIVEGEDWARRDLAAWMDRERGGGGDADEG